MRILLAVALLAAARPALSAQACAASIEELAVLVVRPDLSHLTSIQTSAPAGERRAEQRPLPELERRVRSIR